MQVIQGYRGYGDNDNAGVQQWRGCRDTRIQGYRDSGDVGIQCRLYRGYGDAGDTGDMGNRYSNAGDGWIQRLLGYGGNGNDNCGIRGYREL